MGVVVVRGSLFTVVSIESQSSLVRAKLYTLLRSKKHLEILHRIEMTKRAHPKAIETKLREILEEEEEEKGAWNNFDLLRMMSDAFSAATDKGAAVLSRGLVEASNEDELCPCGCSGGYGAKRRTLLEGQE